MLTVIPDGSVVLLSGGDQRIGAVELQDADDEFRARITPAGEVYVHQNGEIDAVISGDVTPWKVGNAVQEIIDETQRTLDATSLSPYPMLVELEARSASCHVFQGPSTVVLPAIRTRIPAGGWRLATITSADEAYFAVMQDSTASGVLVATRLDRLGT